MMRYRTLTAALTAAALIYSPTPSFAQTAPQPAASHETGLQLADEDDDNHRKRRRLLLWLFFGGVVAALIAYLAFHDGDEDLPTSP
jgi:hypothetical protein